MKMILEGTEDECREVLEALKRIEELLEILEDVIAEEKVSQLSEEG
tara:strand:+ start:219 stop:356 length:138 start_codon:yes stop_codon:yes gene_type:complete